MSRVGRILKEVREFQEDSARAAECMEREARTPGQCIRQSPEEKEARAQVLRCHERWAKELLDKYL